MKKTNNGKAGYLLLVRGKTDEEAREATCRQKPMPPSSPGVSAARSILHSCSWRWGTRRALAGAAHGHGQTEQQYALQCDLAAIKPHDFRRFVGAQLERVNIRQAQQALGHKSIETTARHYDLNELELGRTDALY